MSYQVLARKWRPRRFDQMVGQDHVLQALINALDRERLHHAYLFTGTRGVGKTTVARVFAKALNCERGLSSRPCGECSSCREIDAGRFVDLIEVDAASRTKVEDTRELLENVQYSPTRGRYKVYLIDEVHMLSTHSFNALLKTLEEPPPHVKFLLATTDQQKLPVTVLSRCLQFNLKRLPADKIAAHLKHILTEEGLVGEEAALLHLARAADGSLRDALSLLDQAITCGNGEVTESEVSLMLGNLDRGHIVALLELLVAGDGAALLKQIAMMAEFAPDYDSALGALLSCLHRIALIQAVPEVINTVDDEDPDVLQRLATTMSPEDVQLYYQIGLIGRRDMGAAPNERTGFEMVLLRMLAFRPVSSVARDRISMPASGDVKAAMPIQSITKGISDEAAISYTENGAGVSQDEWTKIIECLPLQGMAKALAANCILKEQQEDRFYLVLAPTHVSLRNPRLEERIQEALSVYLKRSIKLIFSVAVHQGMTPQAQKERMAQDRQRAAEEVIASDGNVKVLQEMFGARIVPDSVRALDD